MKISIKILLFFLLAGISLNLACKKSNVANEQPVEVIAPETNGPEKPLLPTEMGTGKAKIIFSYDDNQLLTKIEYGDGTNKVIQYNKSFVPKRISTYQGTLLLKFTEFLISENGLLITTGYSTKIEGNKMISTGRYDLIYGETSYPSAISYYNSSEKLLLKQTLTFTPTGNLLNETSEDKNLNTTNQFDENPGIFKQVKFNWLFALEEENKVFLSASNNIKQYEFPVQPAKNQTFTYEYKDKQYPSTVNITVNSVKTTSKITYKAMN